MNLQGPCPGLANRNRLVIGVVSASGHPKSDAIRLAMSDMDFYPRAEEK